MKLLTSLLFIMILANFSVAQSVTGIITDSLTHEPISYATISVIDPYLNKSINGTISDEHGAFAIDLPVGKYAVSVDFIGYRKKQLPNITINKLQETINLDTITISPIGNRLSELTVSAKIPLIENKIDKLVYNTANDITAQGGVATDVLKKIPQVSVDIDGNVELQGSGNVRFLINGKPSAVLGNSLPDVLASIPASQIKSIEVLSSPGAKYEAQGTAGIINIILINNKSYGTNGSISLSTGTLLENGSVNLNYRHNKWGISAFLSGNLRLKARTFSSQERLSRDSLSTTYNHLLQNGYSDFKRSSYQSGVNFDWRLTPKDDFSASFGYSIYESTNNGATNINELVKDSTTGNEVSMAAVRNAYSHSLVNSYDWSISYKKDLNQKGQELSFLYSGSQGSPLSGYQQSQSLIGQSVPYTGTQSANPGTIGETNLSLDYSHHWEKGLLIETGIKMVLENLSSNTSVKGFDPITNDFVFNPNQSYKLNFKRQIYAGYISASYKLSQHLDVRMGTRFEHTQTSLSYGQSTVPVYNNIAPSLIIAHNFKDQTIKIAYTRRLERPDYRDINPFFNMVDPYNAAIGNPLLLPEIGDNFEVGYFLNKNAVSLNLTLFERINTQDIKPFTIFYPFYQVGDSIYQNISVATRINIGIEHNTGISLSGNIPITSKFIISGDITAANRHIIDNINHQIVNSLGYRVNLIGNYQLPNNIVVEAFCQYRSPFVNIQGKIPQSLAYTFACKKSFGKKKWSISVTTTNPFNKYVRELTTIKTSNYTAVNFRKIPFRSFGISLSYKFGKLEYKKKENNTSSINNTQVQNSE
ncbi:MAG: TonB-dependent receptor [Bacteroidetes bacterium]|nr:TonB-dependent receptor [Bacteroidota bacterium]